MRGLLIKDFTLFKNQKKMFSMILLVFVIFAVTGALDSAFVMGYLPFVFCIYVMSSISYDEFDNGLAFLMVLPVSRKQYVTEKYIFGSCMGILGSLLAVLLALLLEIKHSGIEAVQTWFFEGIFTMGIILLFVGVFINIMIPIQLKFGSEKGRMVLFGLFMIIIGMGYFFFKYTSVDVSRIMERLENTKEWMVFLLLFVITIVMGLISYIISVHIMKKKEF